MSNHDNVFTEVPEADAVEQRMPLNLPTGDDSADPPEFAPEADPADQWEQASDLPDDGEDDYDRGAADELG